MVTVRRWVIHWRLLLAWQLAGYMYILVSPQEKLLLRVYQYMYGGREVVGYRTLLLRLITDDSGA